METKRTYSEICKDLQTATSPKEFRKLHKELKEYGSGIDFVYRYPNFPIVISLIKGVIVLVAIVLAWARCQCNY